MPKSFNSIFNPEFYKSKEWKAKRQERLRIDRYKCTSCNSVTNLEVHHIISISKGGPKLALSNMVTKCRACHDLEHAHRYKKSRNFH